MTQAEMVLYITMVEPADVDQVSFAAMVIYTPGVCLLFVADVTFEAMNVSK